MSNYNDILSGSQYREILLSLQPGIDSRTPSQKEKMGRIKSIVEAMRKLCPEFSKGCQKAADESAILMTCQDSFAGDYQLDELTLLGMAIKFAGLHGLTVTIVPGRMSDDDKKLYAERVQDDD